ncbi:type VI secretion system contractile sheath small subunit [Rhodocaloribacter litoris]|uniref:type VI secretion system contractile sheath small subunit n=1 Tax=Rhodocaloribacter litoris TaxID=2558931 RepID=UPI00142372EF|nr:type VI secretion system contractile sheath small subunit [Rhodocaloribacter litoris]QXD13871.1 type VI secretion system contractile sheath small subunit [Rhodocaloribacter litoris]GIV60307.1 MAG: type VI secretion system-associated protein [Rhodothermaceae bacterium]
MAKSFQHEKPPARINLFLEVETGGAKKKVELPLRLLVMGDFLGREVDEDVADREIININKENFEDVMRSSNLNLEFTVADKLRGGDNEMKVQLHFDSMKSFSPEQVARQIPELDRLLAARNLLQDLRNRLISMGEFRRELEKVVKDEALREKLLSELGQLISEEEAASGDEEAS